MDEYEFACATCEDHDLIFVGTQFSAEAICPCCGEVEVSPAEIFESIAGEAAGDAQRDERGGR